MGRCYRRALDHRAITLGGLIMIYLNTNQPVKPGDIVHVKNRPYTIARLSGDYVMLQSMDERREFVPVYPSDIGARVTNAHVHDTLRGALKCFFG